MSNSNIYNLEIYKISKLLSKKSREVYNNMNIETKKVIWNQFIRSIDSIWANIAEWYWRFHYMDSVKFYYYARWSLSESLHRTELLKERLIIDDDRYIELKEHLNTLARKLNNFITRLKNKVTNH